MPLVSLLMTVHCNRVEQFEIGLSSLVKQHYDKRLLELVIILDCYHNQELIKIIKKYKSNFIAIKCYLISNDVFKITHSVTRRNFLAKEATGSYIIFSEPEMFHIGETLNMAINFANKGFKNYWYCGPVFATESIVDSTGKINVDEFQGKENIKFLLSLIKSDPLLKKPLSKKNYYQIDENSFPILFFCALFYKKFFIDIGGLNERLKIRGWEEIELYERFSKQGGLLWFDKNFKTIHLPHKRSLGAIQQIGWNLFNSTLRFDQNQKLGQIKEIITKITI